ncbi:hypothetical protein [Streptodolium elevatio]
MGLKDGLACPRTPLRQFLDRELSAVCRPLRESYRAQHRPEMLVLPGPGVGTEAGTVGTAIDQRLRLAFTAAQPAAQPVDRATVLGIATCHEVGGHRAGRRMRKVGAELADRLTQTVQSLDLDDRNQPLDRPWEEEQDLARLLLCAAWYQVAARSLFGFTYTPLFLAATEEPKGFTLDRLLSLPHPDLVADMLAQVHHAAQSPLSRLRASTSPADCTGDPVLNTSGISADADLLAAGLLLDFKSSRHPEEFAQRTAHQLLGYLLLDTEEARCRPGNRQGVRRRRRQGRTEDPAAARGHRAGPRPRPLPGLRPTDAGPHQHPPVLRTMVQHPRDHPAQTRLAPQTPRRVGRRTDAANKRCGDHRWNSGTVGGS